MEYEVMVKMALVDDGFTSKRKLCEYWLLG